MHAVAVCSHHTPTEDGFVANLSRIDAVDGVCAPARHVHRADSDHARPAAVVRVEPVVAPGRIVQFLGVAENDLRHARGVVHPIRSSVIAEVRHLAAEVEVVFLHFVQITQDQTRGVSGERFDGEERRSVRSDTVVPQLLVLVDDLAIPIDARMSVQLWCLRVPVVDLHVAQDRHHSAVGSSADGIHAGNEWELVTEESPQVVTNKEPSLVAIRDNEEPDVAGRTPARVQPAFGVVDQRLDGQHADRIRFRLRCALGGLAHRPIGRFGDRGLLSVARTSRPTNVHDKHGSDRGEHDGG